MAEQERGWGGSHDAALVLEDVWVFVAQSLFGSVLLQVGQLLAVDRSPALPEETQKDRSTVTPYRNLCCVPIGTLLTTSDQCPPWSKAVQHLETHQH